MGLRLLLILILVGCNDYNSEREPIPLSLYMDLPVENGYYVYDYDRMIECFMSDSHMNYEEAIEWIDFNVLGINGGTGFIVLYSREQI